jgi:hypothetical protein
MPPKTRENDDPPEEDEEEGEPEEPEDPESPDLEERVEAILEKVLPKFLKGKSPTVSKRPTSRDLEEEMDELVTSKVKDLLKREKAQGEEHDDGGGVKEKAEPEGKPDEPRKRRVEKAFGWV